MKLLIRDYIASLKERQELDAILPDLLSELGFNVLSKPGRGTAQRGVDVAAIREDSKGKKKVYLFSVKPGDLTRQEWDGNSQKLRSSLNEILDEYIPTRIPPAYRRLKVIIVLCFGGDVHENARSLVTAFTRKHTTRRVAFEEWNGDKLAELLLSGILREELLPKPLRSSFQKAVAMVDQPEIAHVHFTNLVTALRSTSGSEKSIIRSARQMYICLWVLFVWARDARNLDAPYRASELVLLSLWQMVKPFINKKTLNAKAIVSVVRHAVSLHIQIAMLLLNEKILPHVERRHALSAAVTSRASADVNLKLFDMLGRLAMTGHWATWAASLGGNINPEAKAMLHKLAKSGMLMISNNPALLLPIQDEHAIEIALFLIFAAQLESYDGDIRNWLHAMGQHLDITVRAHGRYPCRFSDYQDLISHPKESSDEYRKEATTGSVLIPLIASWLTAFKDQFVLDRLSALKDKELAHCTLQLWIPGSDSEDHLYLNDKMHGIALTDLPINGDGADLLNAIAEACKPNDHFTSLSANRTGYWPIVLCACRYYRLPVPPQFWIDPLNPLAEARAD